MRNLKWYAGDPKLVIAFDIGTTFSGVSYCILERNQIPEILGVTRFPGQAQVGETKVPSLLYYDKSGNVKAAGAEVLTGSVIEDALKEGWTRAEWWKLHLRPKHLASSVNEDTYLPPLPPGTIVIHVLTDFIRYLFKCARNHIQERHLAFSWSSAENSIEYIFTHPNGWDGIEQQLYRRAIESAGLVPSTREGRSRVHMLMDGEASLHFCVANLISSDLTDQATPQGLVIIDAGGGTVDLSMFSMTSNPISCEEVAPAECELHGSVFVTLRAWALVERKLLDWEHSAPDEIAEYTREFDQSTKLVIKNDYEPAYIRVGGHRTSAPEYNISFGKLKLMGKEATGLFNESFDAIIGAFEQQQKAAKTQITMAFFVGGLSTNDWLWSRLQTYFKDKNISICRPDNHIDKAVATGAVLSLVGRENQRVTSRVARATYGVVTSVPVKTSDEEHMRRKHRWEMDHMGESFVPDSFEAIIFKGDKIGEDMDVRKSFSFMESNAERLTALKVRLVCYRGHMHDPKWLDEDSSLFFTYCTISADLSGAVNDLRKTRKPCGKIVYQLDCDVIVYFGLTELKAFLSWKTKDGEHRVPAEVCFEDISLETGGVNQPGLNNYTQPPRSSTTESALRRLEATLSLSDEKDCTIAALTAEDERKVQQITVLRGDIESLRRDLAATRSQTKQVQEDLSSAQKELQTKAALIKERDCMISSLVAEASQLKQLDPVKTREIATGVEKDHTTTAITAADARKAQQVATLRVDNGPLRRDLAMTRSQLKQVQEELGFAKQKQRKTVESIEERDRTITSLAAEVYQLKKLDVDTNNEKDRTITTLTAEDAKKAEQITGLRGDTESLHRDLAQTKSLIKRLREELGSAKKELETKAASIEERGLTIASLAAAVSQFKQLNVEKTRELATSSEKVTALLAKDTSKAEQILALSRDLDATTSQVKQAQEELGSVRRELQTKASLIEERDHTIASLVSQLRQIVIEKTREVATSDEKDHTITALTEEDTRKAEQITALRRDLDTATSQMKQVQEKLGSAQGELASLVEERDCTVASLVSQLNQFDAEKTRAIALSDEKDRTIISLTDEDTKKAEQITALRCDVSAVTSQINQVQEELGSAQGELRSKVVLIEERDRTIASFATEVSQLKQFDVEKTKEIATLLANHEKLQNEFSALSEIVELQKRQQQYEVESNVLYGIVCALPADEDDEEHICRKELWEVDPAGECYVLGHFESKLRVGAHIREEKEFRDAFSVIRSDPADFGVQTVHVACYRGSLPDPKWVDEDESSFSPLCMIHVDLNEAVKDLAMMKNDSGGVYYKLDYDVIISFGCTDLRAELCWISRTGEQRMPAKVSFDEWS